MPTSLVTCECKGLSSDIIRLIHKLTCSSHYNTIYMVYRYKSEYLQTIERLTCSEVRNCQIILSSLLSIRVRSEVFVNPNTNPLSDCDYYNFIEAPLKILSDPGPVTIVS